MISRARTEIRKPKQTLVYGSVVHWALNWQGTVAAVVRRRVRVAGSAGAPEGVGRCAARFL